MKPVYLFSLFYSSIKENEALVRAAQKEVTSICGKDFELMGFGEHSCAIAFSSDLPAEQLSARLKTIQGEKLHCVLVRVESVVGGATYPRAWQWFARHLRFPQTKSKQ